MTSRPSTIVDELDAAVGRARVLRDLLERAGVELPPSPSNGATYAVQCIWHRDATPSLVVAERTGFVECKGKCGRRLDVLDLAVQTNLGFSRTSAAAFLRSKYLGVPIVSGGLRRKRNAVAAPGTATSRRATDYAAWHRESRAAIDWSALPPGLRNLVAAWPLQSLAVLGVGFLPKNGKHAPSLFFPVEDADGRVVAAKLRALTAAPDGVKSRSVGPTGSGILGRSQLAAKPDATVVLAAGENDLAHGLAAAPEFAWTSLASGETGSLGPLVSLFAKRRVVVLYDKDDAGRAGARKVARELLGVAASVRVAAIPDSVLDGGKSEKDVADICTKLGAGAGDVIRAIVADARAVEGPRRRPRVQVRAELAAVADEAERALVADETAGLYARAGLLVRVTRDCARKQRGLRRPLGAAVIEPAASAFVRERLDLAAEFYATRKTRDGEVESPALPPAWVVDTLMARGAWPLPALEGVIEAPTMRLDGTVLDVPGYDAATGLLYEPSTTFPAVPENPAPTQVQAAVGALLEPFVDMPFVGPCDRTAAVAMILTTVGRFAIDGPALLAAVRATAPGTGKTLVVDVVSIVATGRPAARMTLGRDDGETRKLILSIGLEGAPVVLLDNVEGSLGSAALAAALTSTTFRDRLLGVSKLVTVSLRGTTWFATGNGLVFKGDLGRRVLPIDLDAGCEHPEDRTTFKHRDLLAFVRDERPRLVAAALTVLRGYHVAGRPAHGMARVGSFEAWDDLVRGACIWSGMGDPVAGRQRVRDEGDADLDVLRDALTTWRAAFADSEVTISAAIEAASTSADLRVALAALVGCSTEKLDARTLGYALRRVRGRLADGARFENAGRSHGKVRWRVAGCDGRDGCDVAPRSPAAGLLDFHGEEIEL